MSIIMDSRLEMTNKEDEVQKLQELVKKLELQNEELRSERQNLLGVKTKSGDNIDDENSFDKGDFGRKGNRLSNIINEHDAVNSSLNEIQYNRDFVRKKSPAPLPLDVDEEINNETWLIESPKLVDRPETWLRKDVDDPSLVIVKKALINKLDEIENSPHHSPRHSLYSPSSSSGVLSPESPPSKDIDTRTFVRPKKKRQLFDGANDVNRNIIKEEPKGPGRDVYQSTSSIPSEEDERLSSASDGSLTCHLTDVEEVNALARMQEESLKIPDSRSLERLTAIRKARPPSSYNRSKLPYAGGSSEGSAASSQEDLLATYNQRTPYNRGLRATQAPFDGSDISTPPDSPHSSHHNLATTNGRSYTRLPGIPRKFEPRSSVERASPSPSHSSHSRGNSPHLRGETERNSKLPASQGRPSRLSAPSPVRLPPTLSNPKEQSRLSRPQQSSALPRPGSRLQAPKPRLSQSPSNGTSDWREGCY